VHGRHETLNDAELVIDDLGQGREAVGRAGGIAGEYRLISCLPKRLCCFFIC